MFTIGMQQVPEQWMLIPSHGLDTCRPVNVGNRGQAVLPGAAHLRGKEHVREGLFLTGAYLEILTGACRRDCWREGTKRFPFLDQAIDPFTHVAMARVSENAAGAKRSWSVFHASLEPGDDLTPCEVVDDGLNEVAMAFKQLESAVGTSTYRDLDFSVRVSRSPEWQLSTKRW